MHLTEELYQFLQVRFTDLYYHVSLCFAVEMTINVKLICMLNCEFNNKLSLKPTSQQMINHHKFNKRAKLACSKQLYSYQTDIKVICQVQYLKVG